jgi:hypothetical protein
MIEFISPITDERLQVAENDFENHMDWYSAVSECKNLGNGWRLPTIPELEVMYKELHKKGIGNFESLSLYWSNMEHNDKYAYFYHFYDGFVEGYYDKNDERIKVRAVRVI